MSVALLIIGAVATVLGLLALTNLRGYAEWAARFNSKMSTPRWTLQILPTYEYTPRQVRLYSIPLIAVGILFVLSGIGVV